MNRGIFIAGNDSSLSRAIEIEAAKRAEQFALALIPNHLSEPARVAAPAGSAQSSLENIRLPLEWNPSSPISARTLILAAENRLERIDNAILVCAPPSIRRSAAELHLTDIETVINDQIKSWFFLIRELSVNFRSRQAGTLALVYTDISSGDGKDEAADILGPSALASFRAFTRSLLASAFNEPYFIMGFSCTDPGNETAFAAYMFKLLDEGNRRNNGKLHKYGKLNFFK